MKKYEFNINNIPLIKDEISLCLGYFDGIHIGHIELIKKAKESKYKSAILTFNMLGVNFKRNELITSLADREKVLKELGLDYYFVLDFDESIMKLNPDEFIEKILHKLNVKEVVVGQDYTFAYKKSGNVDYLKNYENKFYDIKVVDDILFNDKKISTTEIISFIKDGKIDIANNLLNRPYKILGKVNKGLSNGKKIDFPTANINLSDKYVLPKNGVYFTYTIVDNVRYKSMTNVGVHPTISKLDKMIVETHIFNFNDNLYDKEIEIEFILYLRDETKFASLNELKEQLKKDKEEIMNIKI